MLYFEPSELRLPLKEGVESYNCGVYQQSASNRQR